MDGNAGEKPPRNGPRAMNTWLELAGPVRVIDEEEPVIVALRARGALHFGKIQKALFIACSQAIAGCRRAVVAPGWLVQPIDAAGQNLLITSRQA